MIIEELIQEGQRISEIENTEIVKNEYSMWCNKIRQFMRTESFPENKIREVNVKMHYTENEYSKEDSKKSLESALKEVLHFLQIESVQYSMKKETDEVFTLIGRIMENFYMYFRAMYRNPIHKKGTLQQELLDAIQIGNEYDLQRMLYSILLPIFPTIRQEVENDNGYGGMRADLCLTDYDLIIETKCTRTGMSEKKLLEELGADGFHYDSENIFFFIYDKNSLIKNPEAFKKAFERNKETDGKTIRTFILQPSKF